VLIRLGIAPILIILVGGTIQYGRHLRFFGFEVQCL